MEDDYTMMQATLDLLRVSGKIQTVKAIRRILDCRLRDALHLVDAEWGVPKLHRKLEKVRDEIAEMSRLRDDDTSTIISLEADVKKLRTHVAMLEGTRDTLRNIILDIAGHE